MNDLRTTSAAAAESPDDFQVLAEPRLLSMEDHCGHLLRATAVGDGAAFGCLYQLTRPRLVAVIRKMVWNPSEAEEVLQEAYLKIWRFASSFELGRSKAVTWMSHLARNQAIDHLRRGARRNVNETDNYGKSDDCETGDPAHIGSSAALRPEERLEILQERARLAQIMVCLSDGQRLVMDLSFHEGCTQAEIAVRMGLPLGTIKTWMRRGLQQMKAVMVHRDAAGCSNRPTTSG